MIRGVFLDIRALVYGPEGAELLCDILAGEGIAVTPAAVAEAIVGLPEALTRNAGAMETGEQEDDYNRAMLPLLLQRLGLAAVTDALLLRLLEGLHEYHAYFSLYPEVLPVLEQLKERGITMAVVANWEPSLERLVREFELDGYLAAVLASRVAGSSKPDRLIFAKALRETGLTGDEVLHVGPSLKEDVEGAVAAGIHPVWLNRTGIITDHEVLTITDLRGLLMLAKAGH
ncbi:MAG: HAD-IA family hydrolase [Mycobacterium leprae]